jgi:hypothetical protein
MDDKFPDSRQIVLRNLRRLREIVSLREAVGYLMVSANVTFYSYTGQSGPWRDMACCVNLSLYDYLVG